MNDAIIFFIVLILLALLAVAMNIKFFLTGTI